MKIRQKSYWAKYCSRSSCLILCRIDHTNLEVMLITNGIFVWKVKIKEGVEFLRF